jgi:hypothetical protein
MMTTDDNTPPMTKVLAWLGYAALGLAAMLNAVIATVMVVGGHLAGAIGEAGEQLHDDNVASSANHAALIAKLIALGFFVLAASEYAAGHFLKRRIRTLFVPVACALTVVGEAAFAIWTKRFNALDVVIVACVAFAAWVWTKLPTS